jgi:hypothetical protein
MSQPLLLILGGMSLVGTGKAVDSLGKVALPAAIVAVKVLVLPNIISVLAIEFSVDSSSEQFSFEFGLVPAAASTMVMVGQFGASQELMLMLSGAYAIGRALSIFLLFVFAALLTIPSGEPMRALITHTCVVMHALSLCGTLWIVLLAIMLPRYRKSEQREFVQAFGALLTTLNPNEQQPHAQPPQIEQEAQQQPEEALTLLKLKHSNIRPY